MDYSLLYSTRPDKSVDDDLACIQDTLRDLIKKGKTGVKLINYYHGLPLSFPAKMISLDHGMLDLDVHPQQAVAIESGRYTFLRQMGYLRHHTVCECTKTRRHTDQILLY